MSELNDSIEKLIAESITKMNLDVDSSSKRPGTRSTQISTEEIVTKILGSLIPILTNIIKTIMEEFMKRSMSNLTENKEVVVTNSEAVEMKLKIDDLEQYGRRENLRIHGIKEEENEDVMMKVMETLKLVNPEVAENMISRCHRIRRYKDNKTTAPRQIIVKFTTHRDKDKIYREKKKLSKVDGYQKVYITEDLTRIRHKLLTAAIQCTGRTGVTTNDGNIIIWRGNAPPTYITHPDDLKKVDLQPDYGRLGL